MDEERKELSTQKVIRRRVQIVGGNTITVSIPRSWADRHNLGREPHQEQEVSMRYLPDGTLLLTPANTKIQKHDRRREHRFEKYNTNTIKQTLVADFLGGIDTIFIRFNDEMTPEQISDVTSFVDSRLIGFDTIETRNRKGIDVVNMTQAPQFEVDRLLEIIRVQSIRMMEMCFAWLLDEEIDIYQVEREINDLETKLDRRSNQMMRTLQLSILDYWMAESVNLPLAEIIYWSIVTRAIENAADLAVVIIHTATAVNVRKIKHDLLKELYDLGEIVTDLFSTSITAFIDNDHTLAMQVVDQQSASSITIQKTWPISSAENLPNNLMLILRHLEKIGMYSRRIAEATLDCEAARKAYLDH